VPVSSLYRWAKDAAHKSRRPKTIRKTTWTTQLVQAVEEWRLEEPMRAKAKILVKLIEQGLKVSEATEGSQAPKSCYKPRPAAPLQACTPAGPVTRGGAAR
jgi:hypothetical protein